jgi:hypothetical protein
MSGEVLYNGTTLRIVPSAKPRKPTTLCLGKLCEIQRYFGLHCLPSILRCSEKERWLYCFLIHARNNTGNTYVKIILEKQNDVLVVIVQYSQETFFETFLDVCFCEGCDLIDVRAALMFNTNTFVYDSIRRFINDLRRYECTSHRIIWCTNHTMFLSMYN